MKTIAPFLLLLFLHVLPIRGQEIFRMELENSARARRNPLSGFVQSRIACFQHEALLYLQRKAQKDTLTYTNRWLDTQAYFLADFLALYHTERTDETLTPEEHECLKSKFRDASLQSPVFIDPDEATILKYVNRRCSDTTPFSLDTDWEEAFRTITHALEESRYAHIVRNFQKQPKH